MELEGFGASLIGRAIYIGGEWIPWEFISGTAYTSRILITGDGFSQVEIENTWNYIARPSSSKDWSILATIIRGCGGTMLLTINNSAGTIPLSFYSFLDTVIAEGRTVITRVWLQCMPPCIPDAVFFPPDIGDASFDILSHLPSRGNHAAFSITAKDWKTLASVASDAGLGIVVSDVGENAWNIFWHKPEDSRPANNAVMRRKGISLLKIGTALVEKN